MKFSPRTLLSVLGISLTVVTVLSALIAGITSSVTIVAFASLTVYGILEIAAIDYTPIPLRRTRVGTRKAPVATPDNVIEFPTGKLRRVA